MLINMKKYISKKKFWFPVFPGVILIIIIAILFKVFIDNPFRGKLPEPPAYGQLSKFEAEQIRTANKTVRKKPTYINLSQLAKIYHSNAFYKEAKECYLLAASIKPDDWKCYYFLGYLSSELGEAENEINYYKKATELNHGAVYASYYLGEAYVKLGNVDQAEKLFSDLIASKDTDFKPGEEILNNLYPLKVYAQLSLARLFMTTSRIDSAKNILHQLITNYPDYGPAYRLISNIYTQLGNEESSRENNQRANELCQFIPVVDPQLANLALLSRSDEYLLKQIDIAGFSGNQKWAKMLLDHAMRYMSDNAFLISKSIQFYLLYGFGDDINQKVGRHFNAFANDFNELAKFASLFNKNGKYGWAVMYYERCAVLKPGDMTILHNLAINYYNIGYGEKAKNMIEKLLKEQPDTLKTLTDASSLLIKLRDKSKALQVIQKIEKLYNNDPVVIKLRAEIALNENNNPLADNYYLAYFKKVPDDMETIQYLGARYLEEKSWNKAITHFKKALEFYPNNPEFLEKLGLLLFTCPNSELRDLTKAKYYLERAYFSIKSSKESRIMAGKNLAGIYAEEKNWNKAFSIINTTRIMAMAANLPDPEFQEILKTTEEYSRKSKN